MANEREGDWSTVSQSNRHDSEYTSSPQPQQHRVAVTAIFAGVYGPEHIWIVQTAVIERDYYHILDVRPRQCRERRRGRNG